MLAWYVHHQGRGHATRALAFAAASPVEVLLVSELDLSAAWPHTVRLPADAPAPVAGALPPGAGGDPTAGGHLHWAPIAPDVLGPRTAALVEVLRRPGLQGLVTDVSVEAGVLARLCGVPVVAVHELGTRHDAPHALGRGLRRRLLAPFPAALADPAVDPVGPDLFHAGFVPFPAAPPAGGRAEARRRLGLGTGPVVVAALGRGGHGATGPDLGRLAAELPGTEVVVVGGDEAAAGTTAPSAGLRVDGWVGDLGDHLLAADVVVASAGASIVAEVAAARRPLVCVPEHRPFAEQQERARRLHRAGVARAVTSWSATGALAAAVEHAGAAGGEGWARIDPGPGPAAALTWVLDRLAGARGRLTWAS